MREREQSHKACSRDLQELQKSYKRERERKKRKMTDEEPNNLCQDFYTFLSGGSHSPPVGSNSLNRPLSPTFVGMCVLNWLSA